MAPRRTEIDWPTAYSVAQEVAETEAHPSRSHVAQRLGMLKDSFNKRAREDGHSDALDAILRGETAMEAGGLVKSGTANENTPAPWKIEDVIRAHGDDPKRVKVLKTSATRYGNADDPNHRLRVDWISLDQIVKPADPTSWKAPRKPKVKRAKRDIPTKTVMASDLHAPLQEDRLCEQFFHVLSDRKPDQVKFLGDIIDAERVSRWPARRKARATQEGINAAHDFFQSGRRAHEDAEWEVIPGNHDARIENYLMGRAPELAEVAPAHEELHSFHLARLLKLNELGIKYTEDEEGDWDTTHIVLSPLLAATHKAGSGKNASRSALDMYDHSIAQGDTHRLELKYKTKAEYNVNREADITTKLSAQVGCLCSREAAFYSKRPDFQQGFMMAYIYPDGRFSMEPYIYIKGELLCPGGVRIA